MTFTGVEYVILLVCCVAAYYILPHKLQNFVLFAASIIFYAFSLPRGEQYTLLDTLLPLVVLILNIVFVWRMTLLIEKSDGKRKKTLLFAVVASCVAVLCVFKYFNAFLPMLHSVFGSGIAALALPLGISFYTFAIISYVVDVASGDMTAEKNFIRFAAFVSFFGTITSGPICRAVKVLPQMAKHQTFNAQRMCDAMRLILFGFFRWVGIANVLGLYVNEIFESIDTINAHSGLTLMFAAACYVIQLYFEFSGYSEIARGSALLLGIEIPVNFKTPYFSTNFSGLWGCWHVSLSSWLQDYIFTPLVWSRWQTHIPLLGKKLSGAPPVISSVAIVFIISGFWHGSTWAFVVWGLLQAVFRVGEELMHKYYKKPPKKPKPLVRAYKMAVVFVLWAQSHIFFRIGLVKGGTVSDAFSYIARQFEDISLQNFFAQTNSAIQSGFYTRDFMVYVYIAYLLFALCVAFYCEWQEKFKLKSKHIMTAVAQKSTVLRWAFYYLLISLCLVGFIMQSGGFGTVNFTYANF